MITITIDGKTYKPIGTVAGFAIKDLIERGHLMEEVKENKDSILEKLREELEKKLHHEYMRDKNSEQIKESIIIKGTLVEVLDLLTSLETKKCDHVSDGVVYTSNPPQYKCSKCGVYSTEFMPIETKEEPQPQEDIELPEFSYEYLEESIRDVEFEKGQETRYIVSHIGKHLELLTNAVNQLIKANKK